jgi:hypothetical protein
LLSRFEGVAEAFASEFGRLAMVLASGRMVERRKRQALYETRQESGRNP